VKLEIESVIFGGSEKYSDKFLFPPKLFLSPMAVEHCWVIYSSTGVYPEKLTQGNKKKL